MKKDKKYDDVIIGKNIDGTVRTYKDFRKDTYKINERNKEVDLLYTDYKIRELRIDNMVCYGSWIMSDALSGILLATGAILNSSVAMGTGIFALITSSLGLYAVSKSKKEENIKGQINELKQIRETIIEKYNKMTEETYKEQQEHIDNHKEYYKKYNKN